MNVDVLDYFVGKYVNIFNDKMSMNGILKKSKIKNNYRVDVRNHDAYYIFSIEEIDEVFTENAIIIRLKG